MTKCEKCGKEVGPGRTITIGCYGCLDALVKSGYGVDRWSKPIREMWEQRPEEYR